MGSSTQQSLSSTSSSDALLPPFSLTAPRDDMSTYLGRCRYFYRSINPLMCFETASSLKHHQDLLQQYKVSKSTVTATDEQLWYARQAVEACIHPGSGDVIPAPFRMSCFIPTNIFINPFAMLPGTVASPARSIGIHWFNQSYNCLINYNNRSSDAQPLSILFSGYAAAVVVSVGMALGATAIMKKVGTAPTVASTLTRAFIPGLAMAFASSANVAIMRRNEWQTDGVYVRDEDGEVRGKSTTAGWASLQMCATARVLWNIPCMMAPIVSTILMSRFAFMRARPIMSDTVLCGVALAAGVAPALAFYPKDVSVPVRDLEVTFHNLKRKNGEPVEQLTFYKGL